MSKIQDRLLLTDRGRDWLAQFDLSQQLNGIRLVRALTLVSHSAFERKIGTLLEQVSDEVQGPVALFAARELKVPTSDTFQKALEDVNRNGSVDAVAGGNDLGSEARVAARIRAMCKATPDRFINHPNVENMRFRKCDAIVIVDDLIGSGNRIEEFTSVLWRSRSLRSWVSRKNIRFYVVAFAATEKGLHLVETLHCAPRLVYGRKCPTIGSMPWSSALKDEISGFCKTYGAKTTRSYMPNGYGSTAATLVFEHGCANNVPAILWAPSSAKKPWRALFPFGSVLTPEASVFPPEIVRNDAVTLLVDAGQTKLALATGANKPALSEDTLLILAFADKGIRGTTPLSFATGLDEAECRSLQQRCIAWGFLTVTYRLTESGLAEIRKARRHLHSPQPIAPAGEENYYPKMLRAAT